MSKFKTLEQNAQTAIFKLGGHSDTARIFGVSPQVVNRWIRCGIPEKHLATFKAMTGYTERNLRKGVEKPKELRAERIKELSEFVATENA